jgi:hypothetical protein
MPATIRSPRSILELTGAGSMAALPTALITSAPAWTPSRTLYSIARQSIAAALVGRCSIAGGTTPLPPRRSLSKACNSLEPQHGTTSVD